MNENKIAYVESNKNTMVVDHERNALCDSYIDESIHDTFENYYEIGTCDSRCSLYVSILIFYVSISLKSSCLAKKALKKSGCWETTQHLPLLFFVCSHDYSTILIMLYSFCINKVPSKAFGIVWMIVDLFLCKNRNFCAQF